MISVDAIYREPYHFKKVVLTKREQEVHDKVVGIANLFFKKNAPQNIKAHGILLCGKPQTGKTEILKQACKTLGKTYEGLVIAFIDSSLIAHHHWGAAEKTITSLFMPEKYKFQKKILFFDDIDCLFFGRDYNNSQTHHISISSVMFHMMDNLNTSDTLVIATSNRKDLMDDAMQTRFLQIEVELPSRNELEQEIKKITDEIPEINEKQKKEIIKYLNDSIVEKETGFRDIQYRLIEKMVEMNSDA